MGRGGGRTDDGLIWIYRIVGASDIMKASGGDEPGQAGKSRVSVS